MKVKCFILKIKPCAIINTADHPKGTKYFLYIMEFEALFSTSLLHYEHEQFTRIILLKRSCLV